MGVASLFDFLLIIAFRIRELVHFENPPCHFSKDCGLSASVVVVSHVPSLFLTASPTMPRLNVTVGSHRSPFAPSLVAGQSSAKEAGAPVLTVGSFAPFTDTYQFAGALGGVSPLPAVPGTRMDRPAPAAFPSLSAIAFSHECPRPLVHPQAAQYRHQSGATDWLSYLEMMRSDKIRDQSEAGSSVRAANARVMSFVK